MSDAVLTVLKFCLLALLYLFLAACRLDRRARAARHAGAGARTRPGARAAPPAAPARTRGRSWRLVVVEARRREGPRRIAVDGEATLGRGGGCTVPLTFDTFVSQVHARVIDRDGNLWVEDVGSTNGTIVNEQAHRAAR